MKVTISLDRELHKRAREYVKRTGRTLSGLIQVCLDKKLKEEKEDVQ